MSEIQAISGTRRAIKEMADGTIRVQIDIDPKFRAIFWSLFPSIDMPIALAPLVADFEKREPEPKDHGKHYAVLYKSGWFHNPKVVAAFGINAEDPPEDRIDMIKEMIYLQFGVESLAHIPPADFIGYCQRCGIRSTLPPAFGAA